MDGRDPATAVNDPKAPLRIIVSVIEKPSIRSVSLEGNKKLDDDALNEVIDIASPDVVNQAEIQRNIQRMKDKYIEKGYYLVEIDPIQTEVGNGWLISSSTSQENGL